jgi:hypothetical protein
MNTPVVNEPRKRGRQSGCAAATSKVMPLDLLRLPKVIFKVILEESVVGKIGTSVAFWSVLKVGALWSNFEAHLPFLFHFSLPHLLAPKSRDKTKKAKKALSTEVATSVKGLVAAFLKPRAQKL